MPEIETLNKFMVSANGKEVVFLRMIPQRISADDAMLLAAYLVTMAEIDASNKFDDVLKAVQSA